MAHKTFISYKYSEAKELRDKIIDKMGDEATYYKGETSESPDLTDKKTEYIREKLRDMMNDTSVTIIVLSPNMKESNWIEWEIQYCLREETRKGRTSHRNGLVGVIQKVDGGYSWLKKEGTDIHGTPTCSYNMEKLFELIANNHFNSDPEQWHCEKCKTYDNLNGSYIAFIEEDDFLKNPSFYIDNAYDKSENDGEGYNISLN